MENIVVKNVDKETKRKAVFVLKCKGKNLSDAVREMLEKHASQFEKLVK
jgi:antitoxin component of RelBE/YafQ-DinJ toxin-antitoxin module